MIPYFHAAEHFFYAKVVQLFIHCIQKLGSLIDANIFKTFTEDKCPVRRSVYHIYN